jgi:hypothetical protein
MTEQEINDLLTEAAKLTPEQTEYLARADHGQEIMAVFKSSQVFDAGMRTALGNVRRILSAHSAGKRG